MTTVRERAFKYLSKMPIGCIITVRRVMKQTYATHKPTIHNIMQELTAEGMFQVTSCLSERSDIAFKKLREFPLTTSGKHRDRSINLFVEKILKTETFNDLGYRVCPFCLAKYEGDLPDCDIMLTHIFHETGLNEEGETETQNKCIWLQAKEMANEGSI